MIYDVRCFPLVDSLHSLRLFPMPEYPPPPPGSPPPPPPQIIVQQPPSAFGRYGKLLLVLLGLAVMGLLGLSASYESYFNPPGGPQEKFHSLNEEAREKIAIIDISDTILSSDGFIKQQLDRVRKDDDVVAIVLRIDSPGGTVTASDYLYHHVRKLSEDRNLPVVVSMGGMCASGGYYIAMAVGSGERVVFAEPTTWTGSIGVVIPHYDFSGLLAEYSVKDDSIASHKRKLMGSPTRQLSDAERAEERRLFQELVDRSFARFKEIVRQGRPKFQQNPADLDKVATGEIFTASQALELGLVDEIGFIETAIERAAELAGRSTTQLRCVKYVAPSTPLDLLMSASSSGNRPLGMNLQTLLDLATPRAYYLCTWLPSLIEGK